MKKIKSIFKRIYKIIFAVPALFAGVKAFAIAPLLAIPAAYYLIAALVTAVVGGTVAIVATENLQSGRTDYTTISADEIANNLASGGNVYGVNLGLSEIDPDEIPDDAPPDMLALRDAINARRKGSPVPIPAPPEKLKSCLDLNRKAAHLTNILPTDLSIYPNPSETITEFFIRWNDQALLVESDQGLKKYMGRKLDEIYPNSTIAAYIPKVGQLRNKTVWKIKLPQAVSLTDFSTRVSAAFLADEKPFTESDPDADYKKRTLCQIEALNPIRTPTLTAAVVEYNDPSLTKRYPGENNQNWIDIADPATWNAPYTEESLDKKKGHRVATDALKMHDTYKQYSGLASKNNKEKVQVAVVDSVRVPGTNRGNAYAQIEGAPKLKELQENNSNLVFNPSENFSHGQIVLFRLAAPSNDGLYNAGVISNEALANVDISAFLSGVNGHRYSGVSPSSENFTTSFIETIVLLSGGEILKPNIMNCFNLKCFGVIKPRENNYSIINASVSAEISGKRLRYQIDLEGKTEQQIYEKYGCSGDSERQLLDGRPRKVPIISALPNDPSVTSADAMDCESHYIGVAGVGRRFSSDRSSRDYYNEYISFTNKKYYTYYTKNSSSPWGLKMNAVATRYSAAVPTSSSNGGNSAIMPIVGNSFAAPVISGTIATAMTLAKKPLDYYTAPVLFKLLQASTAFIGVRYDVVDDSRLKSLGAEEPFSTEPSGHHVRVINSDCFLRYFMRTELELGIGKIPNTNPDICN